MTSFFSTMYHSSKALFRGLKDPKFRELIILMIIILLSGTIFYHQIEHWNILDSLYFSVTTLATVGYGDFSPSTNFGKVFTMIYIILGVGLMLGFINAVAHHAQKDIIEPRSIRQMNGRRISRNTRY
jgi:hypothetical protein